LASKVLVSKSVNACAAQITEHGIAKAGRLRERPANRKKCRLNQVEERPRGVFPRLRNSG
jgi:hypothetical protein